MYSLNDIEKLLLQNQRRKIILPEGPEEKIQNVANQLAKKDLVEPWILFENEAALKKAQSLNPKVKTLIIDQIDLEPLIKKFMEIRGPKTNLEDATKVMHLPAYIGAMFCKNGLVDAMVCGLTFTTADTLRPALQIIKTESNVPLASSALIMRRQSEAFIFSDCALNIKPTGEQLADMAILSAKFAKMMGIKDPQLVLLSYSTKGSGHGEQVDTVQSAIKNLSNKKLDFIYDGEMQFDAAFDKEVRLKKSPQTSITKEHPDIFLFPDLQSGNIGYKIAQRLGGFQAAGPFILGLNKPVNDLSRGATEADIYETILITAFQALEAQRSEG